MSANPSVAAAAGPDVDPIGAVTATSSDFSLNRHVSTLEASEKAVGEFVDFVEAIKTSPESQARVRSRSRRTPPKSLHRIPHC
jgi:hypothetical protein